MVFLLLLLYWLSSSQKKNKNKKTSLALVTVPIYWSPCFLVSITTKTKTKRCSHYYRRRRSLAFCNSKRRRCVIMAQKNILVTGGAGYIGSHTVLQLLLGGFNTVVVDNLDNSSAMAIERVKELAADFAHNLSFHKVLLFSSSSILKKQKKLSFCCIISFCFYRIDWFLFLGFWFNSLLCELYVNSV